MSMDLTSKTRREIVFQALSFVPTTLLVGMVGASPPQVDDRDREVLESALKDILNPKNPVYRNDERHYGPWPRTLVIDRVTYADTGECGDMDDPDIRKLVPRDLIDAWKRRNAKDGLPVSRIGLRDKALVIADLSKIHDEAEKAEQSFEDLFREKYPDAGGFVLVSLPGYSRSGTSALIVFHLGPHPHGVTWVSLLAKFEALERRLAPAAHLRVTLLGRARPRIPLNDRRG